MFKWIKSNGCNCCPLKDGELKYFVSVGWLYGKVTYKDGWWTGSVHYSSDVDNEITSISSGDHERNFYMQYVEDDILVRLKEVQSVLDDPGREIYDSLIEIDDYGNATQQKLD